MDDALQPGLLYAYWAAPEKHSESTDYCLFGMIGLFGSRTIRCLQKKKKVLHNNINNNN
jgi:hypothetical protein